MKMSGLFLFQKMLKLLNLTKKKFMKIIFFQNIKNKGTIIETYVRLKDNQSVFSFDSGKRIDEANLKIMFW